MGTEAEVADETMAVAMEATVMRAEVMEAIAMMVVIVRAAARVITIMARSIMIPGLHLIILVPVSQHRERFIISVICMEIPCSIMTEFNLFM